MSKEVDFFNIDMYSLDEEWVNQPRLYHEYAIQLVDAKKELRIVKAELELTRAEVGMAIRKYPTKYKISSSFKITETLVSNTILRSKKYKTALEEHREAQYKVDILQVALEVLDHKKKALESLVSLHGQNYFSEPRPPDEASRQVVDEYKTRAKKKRRQKAKKRRIDL